MSEDSPVYDCAPDVTGTAEDEANWSAAQYGAYKAGCERAAAQSFDGPVVVLRPGVILGPRENVGRLTWWLARIAGGGRVLAPDNRDREIQPVDVRDLAAFTLACVEAGTAGTFNVTAPAGHATFGGMLEACIDTTGSDAQLEWVDDAFLVAHGVRQWTEIPLWRTHPGTWRVDASRASARGCGVGRSRQPSLIRGRGCRLGRDRPRTAARHITGSARSERGTCWICGRSIPGLPAADPAWPRHLTGQPAPDLGSRRQRA